MANHKSAEKRARQSERRRVRNKAIRTGLRGKLKEARAAADSGDAEKGARVREAESALRRAASRGVIPARRASRLISRLNKRANRS